MDGRSYRFTHALVRPPALSVVDGIRAGGGGPPDHSEFCAQHRAYVAALEAAGLTVEALPPLEAFPDSVFIEDDALLLDGRAVVLRPGAPTRLGEVEAIHPALLDRFSEVRRIESGGFIEGGDVLLTDREILVGTSRRTNPSGVAQLKAIVAAWGYSLRMVETPRGVLHFKSDCSLLDSETVLSTGRLAESGCFDGYRMLEVPAGEEPAANVIRVNALILMPGGYPRTADMLQRAGYNVQPLANSEAAKVDGGMSCMSLRYRATDETTI